MITLVKIGGSLITDKQHNRSFRREIAERLAQELRAALHEKPMPLIVGHGSGSFGHFEAKQHGTAQASLRLNSGAGLLAWRWSLRNLTI